MATERFAFAVDGPWARLLPRALREPPGAVVECNDLALSVRFGPFRLTTAWPNVAGASVDGPYRWYRVIGPHLSLADHGVTFGTTDAAGVCVRFRRPVAALFGSRPVHPNLTVTVADTDGLVAAIAARSGDGRTS